MTNQSLKRRLDSLEAAHNDDTMLLIWRNTGRVPQSRRKPAGMPSIPKRATRTSRALAFSSWDGATPHHRELIMAAPEGQDARGSGLRRLMAKSRTRVTQIVLRVRPKF